MEWKSQLRDLMRSIGIAIFAIGLSCMPMTVEKAMRVHRHLSANVHFTAA
jgi:hypothetical protein